MRERSELVSLILAIADEIGPRVLLSRLLDEMSTTQLNKILRTAYDASPGFRLCQESVAALVRMGLNPEAAQRCVETARQQVGTKDEGAFIKAAFAASRAKWNEAGELRHGKRGVDDEPRSN